MGNTTPLVVGTEDGSGLRGCNWIGSAKGALAYYADDGRGSGDDDSRSDDHRSATASEGEYSRRSDDDDYSHAGDDANYAVAIDTMPRKRAKSESVPAKPAAKKSRVTIALSDDDEDGWSDALAELGKLAQSFAVFPPPGGAERKQNRERVAKKAARKKRARNDPLEDLADTP